MSVEWPPGTEPDFDQEAERLRAQSEEEKALDQVAYEAEAARAYVEDVLLKGEQARVAHETGAERAPTLRRSAFALGRYVGGGELSEHDVRQALLQAAQVCGLPDDEAKQALESGLAEGQKKPRRAPKPRRPAAERGVRRKRKVDPAKAQGNKRLTDYGNAERLVAKFGARIRYCPPRGKWLVWNELRWVWDETGVVERLAKKTTRSIYAEAEHAADADCAEAIAKHAHASEGKAKIKAMLELAQTEPGIPVLPGELNADPWAFNVQNGTIDLRTGELHKHRPEDLITKMALVDYDPRAESELYERVLRELTGGDSALAAYLQRAVGYSMVGAVLEKVFFFAFGPPDGGKTTWLNAVAGAFGDYAVSADSETWLAKKNRGDNRDDLVSLLGARLVTSVEVRKGARFDEAMVKRVTGGDPIDAAAKYERKITFLPAFALWLAANDRPKIREDDPGMWSRVRTVPFTTPVPKDRQDKELAAKLSTPEARAAILAWCVQGCMAWQREGLGSCKAVEASTAAYRKEMDRIEGFLDSECDFECSDATVTVKEFREAYEAWCADRECKPLSGRDVAAALEKRGVERKKSGSARSYKGVRLADPEADTPPSAGAWVGQWDSRSGSGQGSSKEDLTRRGVSRPSCPVVSHCPTDAVDDPGPGDGDAPVDDPLPRVVL